MGRIFYTVSDINYGDEFFVPANTKVIQHPCPYGDPNAPYVWGEVANRTGLFQFRASELVCKFQKINEDQLKEIINEDS